MSKERDEFILDIFNGALEGGIGYWSVCVSPYHWGTLENPDYEGFNVDIELTEEEEPKRYTINRQTITKGLRLLPSLPYGNKKAVIGADRTNDASDLDAFDFDAIVQAGLFGEVVYG